MGNKGSTYHGIPLQIQPATQRQCQGQNAARHKHVTAHLFSMCTPVLVITMRMDRLRELPTSHQRVEPVRGCNYIDTCCETNKQLKAKVPKILPIYTISLPKGEPVVARHMSSPLPTTPRWHIGGGGVRGHTCMDGGIAPKNWAAQPEGNYAIPNSTTLAYVSMN